MKTTMHKLLHQFISYIRGFITIEPKNADELLLIIKTCSQKLIINPETSVILENVLNLNTMQVRDIMMPKSQMVFIQEHASLDEMVKIIADSGHSRFPVLAEHGDEILGILHAKDLLNLADNQEFDISDLIRSANFVPESRKLDALLTDFRKNRNHLAIVVDEYGQAIGFVTLEDTLEQIIGDISDEFDVEEEDPIKVLNQKQYIMRGDTELELINERLSTNFEDEDFDTIGGLVTSYFTYTPKRGEVIQIGDFEFKILSASSRRIKLLECTDKRPEIIPNDEENNE
jgi:magnesium and cobalt transporter